MSNDMKLSEKQMRALADLGLLNVAQKNDPQGSTGNAQTMHGENAGGYTGLLASPGVRPDMYQTIPRVPSLSSIINLYKSQFEKERVEILTAQSASQGTNPENYCADPPTAGDLAKCQQYFPFGQFFMKTKNSVLPLFGGFVDRADVPRTLNNTGEVQNRFIPDVMKTMQLQPEFSAQLYQLGIAFERSMERVLVQGSRANSGSGAELGFMTEFDGLDNQIKTGYVDAITSTACPAADSAIVNFNTDIDGTISGGDGRNIVDVFTDMIYGLQSRGEDMYLQTTHVIAVRRELFRALTDVWPCQYNTSRCELINTNDRRIVDAVQSNQLRIDMLTGKYLMVDGVIYPVVISGGIAQGGGATDGVYTQDAYIIPISANGMDLYYGEYFDMENPSITELTNFMGSNGEYRTLNNGLYGVARRHNGFCWEYLFASRMRTILRAPFLAGRIQNISFTFRAPIRTPYPDESFYAGGGDTFTNL